MSVPLLSYPYWHRIPSFLGHPCPVAVSNERAGTAETRATTPVSGCSDRDMDMDIQETDGCLHTTYIACPKHDIPACCISNVTACSYMLAAADENMHLSFFVEKPSLCFSLVQTRIENIIETSLGSNTIQYNEKSSGEGDRKRGVDLVGWTRMDGSSPLIPTFRHATREADSPSLVASGA